ncbi:MAG: hypothetical protein QOG51_540 [Verrucomicrobiota bacterium]
MLPVILQPAIQLFSLSGREGDTLGNARDRVPNIFYQLNPLGNTQLEHLCD